LLTGKIYSKPRDVTFMIRPGMIQKNKGKFRGPRHARPMFERNASAPESGIARPPKTRHAGKVLTRNDDARGEKRKRRQRNDSSASRRGRPLVSRRRGAADASADGRHGGNVAPRRGIVGPHRGDISPRRKNVAPHRVDISPRPKDLAPHRGDTRPRRRGVAPDRENVAAPERTVRPRRARRRFHLRPCP